MLNKLYDCITASETEQAYFKKRYKQLKVNHITFLNPFFYALRGNTV